MLHEVSVFRDFRTVLTDTIVGLLIIVNSAPKPYSNY